MTELVNISEDFDEYIGRAENGQKHILNTEPGKQGWLGNPHTVTEEDDSIWLKCPTCDRKHSRQETVRLYESVLRTRLKHNKDFKEQFKQLKGKKLGRHCSPDKLCHGEIILKHLEDFDTGDRDEEDNHG